MPERYSKRIQAPSPPWWFYDTLIAAALAASFGLLAAGGWYAVLGGLGAATLLYGTFIEPRLLTVKRFGIGPDGAKDRLTIVFISDVHVGRYKKRRWIERLVRRTNALAPDLILLGGDFVASRPSDAEGLEPFRGLKARLGVFAINGNHDGCHAPEAVRAVFARIGIPLLENRAVRLNERGRGLAIVGLDDDWYGGADFAKAFAGVEPNDMPIVMLHNPDLAPVAARYRPAVMFAGHTHGGQIRLPFIGSLSSMPHHLGRRYDRGLFHFPMSEMPGALQAPLVIGQGVGESGPRARLFCPPQIVHLILKY